MYRNGHFTFLVPIAVVDWRFWCLLVCAFSVAPVWAIDGDPDALTLLRKSEALLRSGTSSSVYSVHVVRPDWDRTMKFRSHDDYAKKRFRMEILQPRKARGTVFLKIGDRLSMYLPKLRREISISPAMMHDPWMGSDFNNQDLLESGSLIGDYTHQIVAQERSDGAAIYTIESLPRADAAVSWGKLMQRIRHDGMPVDVEFYCAKQELRRRLRFTDVGELGGRILPRLWVMQPTDKPLHHTEVRLEEIQFDITLEPALFQPAQQQE